MTTLARYSSKRFHRRVVLLMAYAVSITAGLALAATPARGPATGATPATGRGPVTADNKAAADAQLAKAQKLFDAGKYAEAQVENDKALVLDPTNVNAVLMRDMLKNRLASATTSGTTQTATTTTTAKAGVLTPQQISMVRLMELGSGDNRVVGRIDPKVVEDFWQNVVLKDALGDKSNAAHNAFVSPANFTGQVRRIREAHDPKYMEQITLSTDPATFAGYRNNVQTFVLQSCATAECHGGDKGGNFHLISPAGTADQQYTNFYILNVYSNADGQMIDREDAGKSLLLLYALPWQNSPAKHPKIDVKKLTGPNDVRGRNIADWIRTLAVPKPDYGITFEVPHVAAATGTAPAPK